MLDLALTHRSWAFENTRDATTLASNERLELLGDAVLSMCVLDHIYRKYPKLSEGTMSDVRSQAVRGSTLAAVAKRYGVGSVIKLGRGEDRGGGRNNPRLLGDALEAIIAAVYLDAGGGAASAMVLRLLSRVIADAVDAANNGGAVGTTPNKSTHNH